MKIIKSYPTRVEADLAEDGVGSCRCTVSRRGFGRRHGKAERRGVQLLVPDDQVEAALSVLGERVTWDHHDNGV